MAIDEHLEEALHEARVSNALLINRLRAAGVVAFTVVSVVMAFAIEDHFWMHSIIPLSAYLGISLVLMIGGEANAKILWVSRFAVPIFDIPMVFWIQWVNLLAVPGHPGTVSEFSVGLFICLLMMSALTLNSSQIYLSLVFAIAAEQVLQREAGIETGGRLSSAVLLVFATWICVFAGRNRIKLVKRVAMGEARRRRLQRYFSPGVGELLEQQAGGELGQGQEYEVTVIFTDIRKFTAISERMDCREVVALLNSYHARMVEAVFRHGGTLDKYIGDGLMAYFNAPVGQPDHAERAVRCALEMRQQLTALNTERKWHGAQQLKMGIGLHTGRAIVGDIGAPHRREFTAIGEAVNVASRLEEMTKDLGVDLLVSSSTADLLPPKGLPLKELGPHPVRGLAHPLRLLTPDEQEDH